MKSTDERFMRIALAEAAKGLGCTAPNPAVGAVLVKGGKLLARGFHHAAGLPHAEIEAMSCVPPGKAIGATMYVTLEPCSSHGRTPPCTEAMIAAGITRVVYGSTDPDRRHRGKAARILRMSGIKVTAGVLAGQCGELNRHWNHRNTTGMPWIIAKAGMSLDGRIDSPPHRRWITSLASRRESMRLRASVEAILVGGCTVRADDPALTIRGIRLPNGHPQPWRIIWSKGGKIPKGCKLLTDAHRDRTIILKGMSLRAAMKELAGRGISSVLIEGGGHTLGEAFRTKLVDEIRFFIAPVIQGGRVPTLGKAELAASRLRDFGQKAIGSDLMVCGTLRK